jgi:acetyl-CoA carboxylase alpha subunit
LATATVTGNFVDVIVAEMASGVDRAVECWMSQIEQALTDADMTSLGRLQAVRQVVEKYKNLTGKAQLKGRTA